MSAPSSKANSGGEVKTFQKIRIRRPGRHRKKARKQDQTKKHFC